jgi:hypothetical protein
MKMAVGVDSGQWAVGSSFDFVFSFFKKNNKQTSDYYIA